MYVYNMCTLQIDNKSDNEIAPYTGDCVNTWELLYADDTMVMGSRAREINIILQQIEIESGKYNLKLNHDNCCLYIGMNGKANIHSMDEKQVEKADKVEYLGDIITTEASRNANTSNIMSKALGTCEQPKLFWRQTTYSSLVW